MKKRILAMVLAVTTMLGSSMTVFAAENATVTFTEGKELQYSNVTEDEEGNVVLGDAFAGVAPGETRTQTITLANDNSTTVDFYLSTEVLQALEASKEQAAGAGYEIVLTAGGQELYNSALGGYNASGEGSKSGLGAINSNLSEDVLVATLEKGKTADVVMTIFFDGEAMDSNGSVDYTNALGELSFGFSASYEDPTGITQQDRVVVRKGSTQYITQIIEQPVPLAVRTGDEAMILGAAVILVAGIVLLVMARRGRKEEQA